MSEVEISVIMGVLNPAAPHHLHQAVRSILEQSFRNLEMILYDDGSDAASAREIQNVAAWDGRIRSYRSEQNRGLGYALNQCIRYARGRYLARMDADDVAAPNRLEQQLQFLQTHPGFQWVGSNALLMDENGVWGVLKMPERPQAKDFLTH